MSLPSVSNSSAPSDQPDDRALIQRCQAGESAAFDEVVLRHQRQVFAVALRMLGNEEEAKDVAQDAFVRAYRAIGNFRGDAKLSTWLVGITMNLCRNRRRWWARRKRWIVASLDESVGEGDERTLAQQVADPAPTPAVEAATREQTQFLLEALAALDEADREVVVLRDVQGLSYEEIAQALRCQLGTIKSRLNRARLRLKGLLDGTLR